MTGKEAFKDLEFPIETSIESERDSMSYNFTKWSFESRMKIVRRDLEILEFLKKYFKFDYQMKTIEINALWWKARDEYGENYDGQNKEYKMIKAWLKNED